MYWCCLWESQKDKKSCPQVHLNQGFFNWDHELNSRIYALVVPNYLQNCMAVCIFSPRDFFQVYFNHSLKTSTVFKCHKPIFALSHIETNAYDWKLYVHFGTWKNIADILGMYYILYEIDMLFPFIFTWDVKINSEFSCFYMSS